MNYFNRFLIFCCVVGFAQNAVAQLTELHGKVIDGKTLEPLPFANIRLKGTITGTTTDEGGFFYLSTVERVDSVVISYLGYPTKTIKIKRGGSQELNVSLGSEGVELKEVVVKSGRRKRYIDTTANLVYHMVVKNKSRNREENLESYQLEEYEKLEVGLLNPRQKFLNMKLLKPFKFLFDNVDTTTVEGKKFIRGVIKEDLSDVYYLKNPKGLRRYTKATQITGIENKTVSDLASYTFEHINIYDELFVIAGKSFLSPFAHGALGTYRYFLTDTVLIDGRTSYKLHYVGISKVDLALKGYAWIDSASWAVQSIYFRPNEKSNLNFISDYSISQTFKLMNDSVWMLQREELNTLGSILKRKNAMSVLIQKLYDRRNIKLNVPLPETLFNKFEQQFYAPDARTRPRSYWDTIRNPPLNEYEEKVFWAHDTLPKVPAFKLYMGLIKFFTTAYIEAGPVEFGRVYKFVSVNNIEGWRFRLGMRTNKNFSRKINLEGYAAYGLKDKDFKYYAAFKTFLPAKNERWRLLTLHYLYDMQVLGQTNPLLTFDNVITLIRGKLLTRMMKIREVHIDLENEWMRGFSSMISLDNRTYYSIPGIFDFSYRDRNNNLRYLPNFNTTEITIDSRIAPNDKYFKSGFYRYFVTTKYPVFLCTLTAGFLNRNSHVSNYQKVSVGAKQRLSWQGGHTRYQVQYSKIFGTSPYPISYVTSASFGVIFDNYNFNMLKEFEFVTDQNVSLYLEHHFDGLLFNKIPLFNKLKLREIIYFRGLWGNYSAQNASLIIPPADVKSPFKIPYMEASFGIENILNVFRVDFMWRLTYRNTPGAPNFMVKVGFYPNF